MKKLFILISLIFICFFNINVNALEVNDIDNSSISTFNFVNSFKSLEKGKLVKLEYNSCVNCSVTFKSLDEDIASVDSNGVVTGVGEGITTIIGTCNDDFSSVVISVGYYNGYDINNDELDFNYDDFYHDGVDYVIIPIGDNFIDNINKAILSNLNIMISYNSTGDGIFDSNFVNSYLSENINDFISKYNLDLIYYCNDSSVYNDFINNCNYSVLIKSDIDNISDNDSDNYYVIDRSDDFLNNNFVMYDYFSNSGYSNSIMSMNYKFLPTIHDLYVEEVIEDIPSIEDNYTYFYDNNVNISNTYYDIGDSSTIFVDKLSNNMEFNVIKSDKLYKGKNIVIKIDALYSLFDGYVYVDDILLSSKDFKSYSGSTVIEINKKFIDSLNSGDHIVKVMFKNDNYAISKFYIKSASEVEVKNRDLSVRFRGIFIPIVLIIILLIGIRLIILQRKVLKK